MDACYGLTQSFNDLPWLEATLRLPTLGIRVPKYAALLTPTAPITALKITQIHGLHGIRPISNNGLMLAHTA